MPTKLGWPIGMLALGVAVSLSGCAGSASAPASPSPHASGSPSASPSPSTTKNPAGWAEAMNAADAHLAKGEFRKAIEETRKLEALAGDEPARRAETYQRLGQAELGLGQVDSGLEALAQSVHWAGRCSPPDDSMMVGALLTVGAANYTVGRYPAALEALQKADHVLLEHTSSDIDRRKTILECLAQVQEAAGQVSEAADTRSRLEALGSGAEPAKVVENSPVDLWLKRRPASGTALLARFAARKLPIDPTLAETRWLGRGEPTPLPATASPTPSAH